MNCKETLENLALLLDGELDHTKEGEVLEHLHDCWHCSEYKENERKLKELIREKMSFQLKTPASLVDRIKQAIHA